MSALRVSGGLDRMPGVQGAVPCREASIRCGHNRSHTLTCQRRGFGLACIVLCAAVLPVAQGAAAPSSGKSGASSSAAATAAPRITATTAPTPASAAQVRSPNPPASRAALPPLPLTGDAVLANIKQTLDWYRESQSLEQVPQLSTDVVERDRLRKTALTG